MFIALLSAHGMFLEINECSTSDSDGDGYTTTQGDCDDTNAAVNPGAIEVCNGIDDN